MAAIKPIEARSVHQIQSGQVIVDLCSVVKELVENSLDAGATTLEVRFKNNGLDSIEVQDNGSGIASSNWDALALKHHTSKLASYDDLSSLNTFGFRGEALSSLCALSTFSVVTAVADEAPKGHRLDFDSSGKLKKLTILAAQTGTTAVVEGLFEQLPVRRKELTKNIKREYGKVLGLLHAYACIGTHIKFTVKSSMPKGKNVIVFATKGNPTTKENIANIYGAKTLSALVTMDLALSLPSDNPRKQVTPGEESTIVVRGHVSRPVFGEGRQTPDRQMFFVNGRPCGLPQIAKAFNEVYKSFNASQSPFVFADLVMNTNSYDVNVSPDKRTILLHNAAVVVETLKASLTDLFDHQQQTVPQSQIKSSQLPIFAQLGNGRTSLSSAADIPRIDSLPKSPESENRADPTDSQNGLRMDAYSQPSTNANSCVPPPRKNSEELEVSSTEAYQEKRAITRNSNEMSGTVDAPGAPTFSKDSSSDHESRTKILNHALSPKSQQPGASSPKKPIDSASGSPTSSSASLAALPPRSSVVQNAFDRMRPTRPPAEVATITVGDKVTKTLVGRSAPLIKTSKAKSPEPLTGTRSLDELAQSAFTRKLRRFTAYGGAVSQENNGTSAESNSSNASDCPVSSGDKSSDEEAIQEELSSQDIHGITFETQVQNLDDQLEKESEEKPDNDSKEITAEELIRLAEQKPASLNLHRPGHASRCLRHNNSKDSTTSLELKVHASVEQVELLSTIWHNNMKTADRKEVLLKVPIEAEVTDEERLDLTIFKDDFSQMHIVGQFNLGFILSIRPSLAPGIQGAKRRAFDELFIIDQHASDEKFNFERLQEQTVVGSQRLVRPKHLELTAVEEEVLMDNIPTVEKNGFLVDVEVSGEEAIGQRCKLVSIPLSEQMAFGLDDLEELLHLLAESPSSSQSMATLRPSKVRKMFAMRACRSSIMIGRPLTDARMRSVVEHMGKIDKPWNCPHGRPTMRHLLSLDTFKTWHEGDGVDSDYSRRMSNPQTWVQYAKQWKGK